MSSGLITKKVMDAVSRGLKKSNLEVVMDYLSSEPGAVILDAHQEFLLQRLEYVDTLFSSGKHSVKDIANMMFKKFNSDTQKLSLIQCRRDVQDAEFAFGSTRRSNRAHKIYRHVDRIEALIIAATQNGQLELVIKLNENLNKALALLPEDKVGQRAPTQIVMNITQNNISQISDNPMSDEDAEEIVRKKFELKGIVLNNNNDDNSDENRP